MGKLGLSPDEFWNMGLTDFMYMAYAHSRQEEEYWDREYQRTAWQTSLLMNATGNYGKKKITPADLYQSPLAETQAEADNRNKNKEYVQSEQSKLQELFGL